MDDALLDRDSAAEVSTAPAILGAADPAALDDRHMMLGYARIEIENQIVPAIGDQLIPNGVGDQST